MPFVSSTLSVVKVLWPKGLNTSSYLSINRFSRDTTWAHPFMHAYALWLGPVLLAIGFLVALSVVWWRRDTRSVVVMALGGAGTLVALGLNQIVGHAAEELRPYDAFPHALVLVGKANDYAFPSDHAVVAGAIFTSILLAVRRRSPLQSSDVAPSRLTAAAEGRRGLTPPMVGLAAVSAVLSLFLAFARVYVGAHYPGDVVAGLLLGGAVVVVVSAARPLGYRVAGAIGPTRLGLMVGRPPTRRRGAPVGRVDGR